MKKKRQIVVVVGVIVKNDTFLLTLRHAPGYPLSHNKWQLPGGKVEFGEVPQEALYRELREEIGVNVELLVPYQLVGAHTWNHPKSQEHTLLIAYICSTKDGSIILRDEESKSYAWVTIKDLVELDCLPLTKEFIEKANHLLHKP